MSRRSRKNRRHVTPRGLNKLRSTLHPFFMGVGIVVFSVALAMAHYVGAFQSEGVDTNVHVEPAVATELTLTDELYISDLKLLELSAQSTILTELLTGQ